MGATNSTAASALRAQIFASSYASSTVTSAPTFPSLAIFPSTIGNWPAVNTKFPVRVAGTYAAIGFDVTGRVSPFSASFARTSVII